MENTRFFNSNSFEKYDGPIKFFTPQKPYNLVKKFIKHQSNEVFNAHKYSDFIKQIMTTVNKQGSLNKTKAIHICSINHWFPKINVDTFIAPILSSRFGVKIEKIGYTDNRDYIDSYKVSWERNNPLIYPPGLALNVLRKQKEGTDYTFPGTEICCHKSIVMRFPFFYKALTQGNGEGLWNKLDPETIEHVMTFLYTECFDPKLLDIPSIHRVFLAAIQLELPLLQSQALNAIKTSLSDENLSAILSFADHLNDLHLKEVAMQYAKKSFSKKTSCFSILQLFDAQSRAFHKISEIRESIKDRMIQLPIFNQEELKESIIFKIRNILFIITKYELFFLNDKIEELMINYFKDKEIMILFMGLSQFYKLDKYRNFFERVLIHDLKQTNLEKRRFSSREIVKLGKKYQFEKLNEMIKG